MLGEGELFGHSCLHFMMMMMIWSLGRCVKHLCWSTWDRKVWSWYWIWIWGTTVEFRHKRLQFHDRIIRQHYDVDTVSVVYTVTNPWIGSHQQRQVDGDIPVMANEADIKTATLISELIKLLE